MAEGMSTSALSNGTSEVLTDLAGASATWTAYTASYVCSVPADAAANAWLEGSADGGTTWFPLVSQQSAPPSAAGRAGVRFYTGQPVNAVQAFVTCSAGSTVTVTVTGE